MHRNAAQPLGACHAASQRIFEAMRRFRAYSICSLLFIFALSQMDCAWGAQGEVVACKGWRFTRQHSSAETPAVNYEFEHSTEGWGNTSALSMGMEISVQGGVLELAGVQSTGSMDSPLLLAPVNDYTVLAIRCRHQGKALLSRLRFRRGHEVPPARYAQGHGSWGGATELQREFSLRGGGQFSTHFISLSATKPAGAPRSLGNVTQIRLELGVGGGFQGRVVQVQYIRLVQAPAIQRVTGCQSVSHPKAQLGEAPIQYPRAPFESWVRPPSSSASRWYAAWEDAVVLSEEGASLDSSLPYAATYACASTGGDRILIEGSGFGAELPIVSVGRAPCTDVRRVRLGEAVTCLVPPGNGQRVNVSVATGKMPGLASSAPLLSYAQGPRKPPILIASNIGARHLDLSWMPSTSLWEAWATTGYAIQWRREKPLPDILVNGSYPPQYRFDTNPSGQHILVDTVRPWQVSQAFLECCSGGWGPWGGEDGSMHLVVGNMTTTTVVGLQPDTRFQFRIAALSEPTLTASWLEVDLYGHRREVPGFQRGPWSEATSIERTLDADFAFPFFNANFTLNHGAKDARASLGQLGNLGGQGHYGLLLVGSASVGGCNATHSCCDGFGGSPAVQDYLAPKPLHWVRDMEQAFMYPADTLRGASLGQLSLGGSQEDTARALEQVALDPVGGLSAPFQNFTLAALQAAARHNALVATALQDGWSNQTASTLQSQLVAAHQRSIRGDWNFRSVLRSVRSLTQGAPDSTCTLQCAAQASILPLYVNGEAQRRSTAPKPLTVQLEGVGLLNASDYAWAVSSSGFPGDVSVLRRLGVAVLSMHAQLPTAKRDVLGRPRAASKYPTGIQVGAPSAFGRPATSPCGPVLRITPPMPRQVGAAWYPKAQQVREGFSTRFRLRLASPSTHCKRMHDGHTHCRSRGGDGIAFVVQNQHPSALGAAGQGLGYEGIKNSIAVEFDSFMNYDQFDPMENHISVQTRGWEFANSANHSYSLGQAVRGVPDLTDGVLDVRVTYTPAMDVDEAAFMADNLMSLAHFITNGRDFKAGAAPQWVTGLGVIRVYLFGAATPLLTVPCNLENTLRLDQGRAWVGFTASTGSSAWQGHEVLAWEFTQERQHHARQAASGPAFTPNGEGGYLPFVSNSMR